MNTNIMAIAEIAVAALLIVSVLLQERSSGSTGLWGGSAGDGGFYHVRRGMEKIVFGATVALVIAFVALSLLDLVF